MSAKKSLSEFMGGVTVFGRLTLLREVDPWEKGTERKRRGLFRCDCGVEKIIDLNNVRKGASRSCGGHRKATRKTHGMSKTRQYGIWCGMKDRCYNKNDKAYPDWGGRGIKICEEWREDFKKFYDDIGQYMPEEGDYSIHRVDNDGDYCKENCIWATRAMQANNRRNTPRTNINGESVSLAEFAAEMGIKYHFVYHKAVTMGMGLHGLIDEFQEKLNKFRGTSAE